MQTVSRSAPPMSHSEVWEKAKEDLIPAIDDEILGFCSCDEGRVERREWFTDRIVEDITRNYTDKSSPLVYVAFACGGLAHDYLILSRLVDEGYTNLEIHLIDPAFPKVDEKDEAEILQSVKDVKFDFLSDGSRWNPLREVTQKEVSNIMVSQIEKMTRLVSEIAPLAQKWFSVEDTTPVTCISYLTSFLSHLIQYHNFEVLLKAKGVEKLDISRYLSATEYLSSKGKISEGKVFVLLDPSHEDKSLQDTTPRKDTINCLATNFGATFFPLDKEPVIKGKYLEPILGQAKDIDSAKKILKEKKIFFEEKSDIHIGFNDVAAGNPADNALFYILDEHSEEKIPDSIKMRLEDVTDRLFMRSPFSRAPQPLPSSPLFFAAPRSPLQQ